MFPPNGQCNFLFPSLANYIRVISLIITVYPRVNYQILFRYCQREIMERNIGDIQHAKKRFLNTQMSWLTQVNMIWVPYIV